MRFDWSSVTAGCRFDKRAVIASTIYTEKPGTVTIAGHPAMELDPKTEKSILNQAGLDR